VDQKSVLVTVVATDEVANPRISFRRPYESRLELKFYRAGKTGLE
jgi:hypothetical protein